MLPKMRDSKHVVDERCARRTGASESPATPVGGEAQTDKSSDLLGCAGVSVSLRLEFISSRPSDALGIRKLHG